MFVDCPIYDIFVKLFIKFMKKVILSIGIAIICIACGSQMNQEKIKDSTKKSIYKNLAEEYIQKLKNTEYEDEKLKKLLNYTYKNSKLKIKESKALSIIKPKEHIDIKDLKIKYAIPVYYHQGKITIQNLRRLGEMMNVILVANNKPKAFLMLERATEEIKERMKKNPNKYSLGEDDIIVSRMVSPDGIIEQIKLIEAALKESKEKEIFFIRGGGFYSWIEKDTIKYIDMNFKDFSYTVKIFKK